METSDLNGEKSNLKFQSGFIIFCINTFKDILAFLCTGSILAGHVYLTDVMSFRWEKYNSTC